MKIMMEFPKPKDEDEQVAESITERKQVIALQIICERVLHHYLQCPNSCESQFITKVAHTMETSCRN